MLSEYAREAELYFTSNTTMVFLPGDHVLDTNITVTNVAKLTMRAFVGNIATIVCSGSVGLKFTSMVGFKIHSLAFTSCSRNYGSLRYALLLQHMQCTELVNCSFHDDIGTALIVINTNLTLSGNTKFTHNHCELESCVEGGGIIALNSKLTFTGNTTFLENIVHGTYALNNYGGAIYASQTILSFNGITNFIGNLAQYAGAIYAVQNTVVSFNGTSNFINNSAYYGLGGAMFVSGNTLLSFNGTNNFINNSAYGYGGAIFTSDVTILTFNGTNNFIGNSAGLGGAICAILNTLSVSFNGINNFISNVADGGGALYVSNLQDTFSFNGTNNFIGNVAHSSGGVLYSTNAALTFNGTNNFTNNSAEYGGVSESLQNTTLTFHGTNNFISNTAAYHGGAIYLNCSTLSLNGTSYFISNSAGASGGVFFMYALSHTVLSFSRFINNSAHSGGAIYTHDYSTLTFHETIYFTNNRGRIGTVYDLSDTCGGGVYMGLESNFSILPGTTVHWENNHATLGGAICVRDASPVSYCDPHKPKEECFFQFPAQNLADIKLIFKNNSADTAGSVLYGGAIDYCKLTHSVGPYSSGEVFDMIFNIHNTDYSTISNISSNAVSVCPCENNLPNCSMLIEREVYPGETFQVSVVALGQRKGTVPSSVRSVIYVGSGKLQSSQYLQQASDSCTKLNYTVHSLSRFVGIVFHAEGNPCSTDKYLKQPTLIVHLYQTCPPGFKISESAQSCICEPRLAQCVHPCNITNGTGQITRQSGQQFWVGYDNASHGVILHPHCPFDHCVNNTVVFSLDETDLQCAYNKSGLLCGACKEGYSLVLGTPECRKCTNSHLVLLVPFAVMGVALVFLLLVCKLTVATGTLSGLVFYANIVGINRNIFLPVESTNAFSIFITWLNLDFGIETCFYDGLDTYSKTWLQFVFPVYIWVLVGLMVQVSRFSQRFARLLGNNPVSVLSTLILLSYTKILRTLITVLYVTYLEYPTYNRMVWLYDGNIDYLSGKHIPLFLVAILVFLFLFLPYTLLLLFGQWLQAISHLRFFSWVNSARLKAFMDSYHAPYKGKHRYWPGLLLVLRFVLLLVFAFQFNPQPGRASINLLAILVGAGILQLWAWISGGVYRSWCLDALEGSFVLNLIVLVGATSYVKRAGGNQLAVGYTSVSIAFATFVCILVYHLANVTGIIECLRKKRTAVRIRNGHQVEVEVNPSDDFLPDRLINPGEYEPEGHAAAEPTEEKNLVDEEQKTLLPVYTYGAIS